MASPIPHQFISGRQRRDGCVRPTGFLNKIPCNYSSSQTVSVSGRNEESNGSTINRKFVLAINAHGGLAGSRVNAIG